MTSYICARCGQEVTDEGLEASLALNAPTVGIASYIRTPPNNPQN